MTKQPDLLDWQPPSDGAPQGAILIPFPLDRDIGRVRHVARLMLSKTTEKARNAYWQHSICARLGETLHSYGIPPTEVRRQLEAFSAAVGREMNRQQRENDREQA